MFEDIVKSRGVPRGRGEEVTISWRVPKAGGRPKLSAYIGVKVARELAWSGDAKRKILFRSLYDPDTNRLRLEPAMDGFPVWSGYVKSGTACITLPMDHLDGVLTVSKAAASARFEVDRPGTVRRGLTVYLPVWAWHAGKAKAREAADQARARAA